MTKICVIGGGTGQSIILKGLKKIENVSLSAIVSVSDDGGSTGKLRSEFNMPGMGDIRSVMVAMANEETYLPEIIDYRFDSLDSQSLGGHSLGNLILAALTQRTGNFMEAVGQVSKILKVKGEIIPSSLQSLVLMAKMEDGTIVRGESNIPLFSNNIDHVYFEGDVIATQEAVDAIMNADIIVYGVGSVYTSILPNVIIPKINSALQHTKAKTVYYCNVMTQPGETDNYSVEDHVNALIKHIDRTPDFVVVDNNDLNLDIIETYSNRGSSIVKVEEENHDYQIIYHDVVSVNDNLVRHDSDKIRESFKQIMELI